MTFDECLEEIKRESPEARKCIEIAEGIADIMYKEDYVKVVRCKECTQADYSDSKRPFCMVHEHYLTDDYFCADGERRTE